MNSQTKTTQMTPHSPDIQHMQDLLEHQRLAYQRHQVPSAKERIDRLSRLRRVLVKYQDQFADAINHDYYNRSIGETKIGELLTCLEHIKYYSKHLSQWMKPSKRHVAMIHQPAKAWVQYQPMGVIGQILERALAEAFPQDLVAVVNGGGPISDAFSHLPFDKIIFTGSTAVGKTVMAAAAENLVPVILELGGKSPVVVHPSMNMKDLAQRIAVGKLWNAGQTCVAPDYMFLPKGKTEEFIAEFRTIATTMYPHLRDNQDYTSIVNDKQYRRVQSYLDDAREQGAQIVEINPKNELLEDVYKIAPTLVTGVTSFMQIMQNEIFGPVLPIMEYDQIDEVIEFINQRPRPLALYYFDYDSARADYIAQRTHSGHFGMNTVLTHVAQDDLPFGGIGASGMGKYHGPEGFFSLSHERSMMSNSKLYSLKFILPPFNKPLYKLISKTLLR